MPDTSQYLLWDAPRPASHLSEAVFAGDLVLVCASPQVGHVVERARGLVGEVFGGEDPQGAERTMEPDAFRRAVGLARRQVASDDELARLWAEVLNDLGYHATATFQDRLRLRAVPSESAAYSRFARPLPNHRDSWGARIHAQINWWLPLYRLTESRTMLVWPQMFRTPIDNTSDEWDYVVLVSKQVKDYPILPEALSLPTEPPLAVTIEPGTLLAFSAAHLHGSINDASGRTRFSLDTRTVWADDVRAGRGAPNVDCARKPPLWELFTPSAEEVLGDLAWDVENQAIGGAP